VSILSTLEIPFSQVLLLHNSNEFTLLLTVKSTLLVLLYTGLSPSLIIHAQKETLLSSLKNKAPSALFEKTVETFVVIGLPDVLSTILLNVKFKSKTVTTLWKNKMFYGRIFT
jgi:hypothetical protein